MTKPIILTTPKGIAKWPYLTEPDKEFNPEGLFHTKLSCSKADSVNIKKAIDDMIAQEVKKQHDQNPDKEIKKSYPYTEEGDDIIFNFKMKASGVRKSDKKRKNKGTGKKKEPSGFAKPSTLSGELCTFLKLPVGTKLARTEVTRYLNQYIKSNDLRDPSDKRIILPNNELKTLLGVGNDEKVTYFNLQKFISRKNLVLKGEAAQLAAAQASQ